MKRKGSIDYTILRRGFCWSLIGRDRFRLDADVTVLTPIRGHDIETEYCHLYPSGWLTIFAGVVWDGASGPTLRSDTTDLASLVHDELYRLIDDGLLDMSCRWLADVALYVHMRLDGAYWWRAAYYFVAVRAVGRWAIESR